MQGSQFRNANQWINDPLTGVLGPFMSQTIPTVFGPQNIPYLSGITQLAGTGYNALAAVPTTNITQMPFIVKIAVTGDQDYQLQPGVITGPGTVAPNDQAVSNKTWVSIG